MNYLMIKNATKQGYLKAYPGDGVDISSRMEYHRGTVQHGICQTIDCQGGNNKGVVIDMNERFFKQASDTFENNDCDYGDTNDAFNEKVNKSGISPTLTTRPEGFKTAILPVTENLRVRKLTPKECWRLQGFPDESYEKASKVCSPSQLYKQAGNSIAVPVLQKILLNLLEV